MKIGATSFVFRYLLMDPSRAPRLETIVEKSHQMGIDRLQICENARPLEVTLLEWEALLAKAKNLGIEIHLGCKTLDAAVLDCYLQRASMIPSRTMRVVLEDEDGPPTRERIDSFLKQVIPLLEKYRMRLAIENHFDVSVRQLAAAAKPFPEELVGFCLDVANSLRRFEPAESVFEFLSPRAYCYHMKDFKVAGSNVGFTVGGAPFGKGDLDLDWVFNAIRAKYKDPELYLETWVPASGIWERDVQTDWEWLSESVENLRGRLSALEGFK
jgi:sugar phosphate isomerase/epimerase